MPKILVNRVPRDVRPVPLAEKDFDYKLDLKNLALSVYVDDDLKKREVILCIDLADRRLPVARVSLYHSGAMFNYEQTFESAKILASEICRRFNLFKERGQQCLELL